MTGGFTQKSTPRRRALLSLRPFCLRQAKASGWRDKWPEVEKPAVVSAIHHCGHISNEMINYNPDFCRRLGVTDGKDDFIWEWRAEDVGTKPDAPGETNWSAAIDIESKRLKARNVCLWALKIICQWQDQSLSKRAKRGLSKLRGYAATTIVVGRGYAILLL